MFTNQLCSIDENNFIIKFKESNFLIANFGGCRTLPLLAKVLKEQIDLECS